MTIQLKTKQLIILNYAEVRLGEINTGEKDGYGNDWPATVYVCKKCRKKICKKLGLRVEEEE